MPGCGWKTARVPTATRMTWRFLRQCLGQQPEYQARRATQAASVDVQTTVLGHARHQVFHLVLQDATILQNQMLMPIRYVRRVDERHMRRFWRAPALERVA